MTVNGNATLVAGPEARARGNEGNDEQQPPIEVQDESSADTDGQPTIE